MTSSVSICSNALVRLGDASFSSFEVDRPRVRDAANLYASERDALLREHNWNCCVKRVILAPMAEVPPFDFAHQFMLPSDWIRTIQIGRFKQPIPYQSEGNRILANQSTLPIVYVFRNEVESTWHTHLINCMELRMAAAMAYLVTGSTSLRDSYRDEYTRALRVAKAVDGQDNPPEEFGAGYLYESRF